jgi:ubiquinone/menaquinone biosynthesis C-methylase UbiE
MATQFDPRGIEPQAVLAAADFRGARVLEIGSGDGRLTHRIGAAARELIGIDLKLDDLKSALEHCPEKLRPSIRFAGASATALPFRDAGFDIAILASAL